MNIKLPLALVLSAVAATTGCKANDSIDDQYCRNGGSSTGYTCETGKQVPDQTPAGAGALASTDQAWMRNKLAEIKTWLQEDTPPAEQRESSANIAAVRGPTATVPELMRIEKLSANGNHRGAMSSVNSYLASNPDNLDATLTKGLVLSNMGQLDEAEALLKNAIIRQPNAPELYNNLAVLYSQKGDYGLAIETLLQAFNTHPTYAQVHHNLKELYATVASQAYSKALDLNAEKSGPKLVMLGGTTDQASANTQAPAQKEKPASNSDASQRTASTQAPSTTQQSDAVSEQLIKAAVDHVLRWANAWANQDVENYINSYQIGFTPEDGRSYQSWKTQRYQRLSKPTFIRVELADVKADLQDNQTAVVSFKQMYQSNTYKDHTRKQLVLKLDNGQWVISKERSL